MFPIMHFLMIVFSELMNWCSSVQVAHSDYQSSCSIQGIVGDSYDVSCDIGYVGGGLATCSVSGVFNTVPCEQPITCGVPARQRGYVFSDGDSSYNDTRISRCATAFQGTPSKISCLANGSWTFATGCEAITSDCSSQQTTILLTQNSISACDGSCENTAQGMTCLCGEGYQDSPESICEPAN